jgi:hypothetical protein
LWIPKTPSGLKMQVFAPFVRSIIVSTMSPFFIVLLALVVLLAERIEGLVSQEHAKWTSSQAESDLSSATTPRVGGTP